MAQHPPKRTLSLVKRMKEVSRKGRGGFCSRLEKMSRIKIEGVMRQSQPIINHAACNTGTNQHFSRLPHPANLHHTCTTSTDHRPNFPTEHLHNFISPRRDLSPATLSSYLHFLRRRLIFLFFFSHSLTHLLSNFSSYFTLSWVLIRPNTSLRSN